jgi:hypothetical protein
MVTDRAGPIATPNGYIYLSAFPRNGNKQNQLFLTAVTEPKASPSIISCKNLGVAIMSMLT